MRSNYRNRYPIDNRYDYYSRPQNIVCCCPKCGEKVDFSSSRDDGFPKIGEGVYQVVRLKVPNLLFGKGLCRKCGLSIKEVLWPEDSYYKIEVKGGLAWAWNFNYLIILRDRISGKRYPDRHYINIDSSALYYLARIPKFVVIKTNREKLIKQIERFISNR